MYQTVAEFGNYIYINSYLEKFPKLSKLGVVVNTSSYKLTGVFALLMFCYEL